MKVKQSPKLPGISELPPKYKVLSIHYRSVEVIRPDGLTVFFDRKKDKYSAMLNRLRLSGSPRTILLVTGMVRGLQVSESYWRKHSKAHPTADDMRTKPALRSMRSRLAESIRSLIPPRQ